MQKELISIAMGVAILLAATSVWARTSKRSGLALVTEGKPRAILALPLPAAALETLAAEELIEHIERMSGARLEVAHMDAHKVEEFLGQQRRAGRGVVFIGSNVLDRLKSHILARGTDPGSFMLEVTDGAAYIAGLSDEGTLFGAYELLEQMGVRWFMPGDLGTVIPEQKTLHLNRQTTVQVPSFHGRWHGGGDAYKRWAKRVRMGGPYFPSSHGLSSLSAKGLFEEHPEYFSLVNGQRVPNQLCVSHPEVIQRAIAEVKAYFREHPDAPWYGMGPNDGSGFCECPNCSALDGGDWDPFSNEPSVTDRYLWFFNQILDGIEDEFPDKKICFYAYHTYMRPPVKVKPNPRIVPALAPIALCRVHGMSNPVCPERSYYKKLMEGWGKALPEVYERGYWFNLADPGFPFSHVHRLRDEIPMAKTFGIRGWRVETRNHWGSETPSLYIAAKLMWDPTADVDALLQNFYDTFFGPASQPMGEYLDGMDAALRDSDHHTGCSFDMPFFYPEALRTKARKRLDQAGDRAGEGVYGERVRIFRTTFEYLEAFIAMLEHRNAYDFVAAKGDLDRLDALRETLVNYDPPMIHSGCSQEYMDRFFRPCTEQGFQRVTGGNTFIAGCEDEWDFLIDPQGIGEDIGLWRKDITGGNFQRIRTFSTSWGNQGLRTYKGEAWYRQTVHIPARFAGQRIFLWFGGVDEKAEVWINGKEVGISHSSSFVPFELDATEAVIPGGENVLVVRILNEHVNELGTGGIMAPVLFYVPAEGEKAKLQNTVELGRTFP